MDNLLTFITFIPLLGALLILLIPKDDERTIKNLAVGISFVPLLLAIYLWFAYSKVQGGYQFEVLAEWIPAINVNYHVGVDGLSIPLIFLTALLASKIAPACVTMSRSEAILPPSTGIASSSDFVGVLAISHVY